MKSRSTFIFLILGAVLLIASVLLGGCGEKKEAKYPTKPVTIVVPSAVGGTADIHARLVSTYLEKLLGQPVTIVNKPGAGTMIGNREIARANPDGYTIGILATPESPIVTALQKQAGYKNEDMEVIASFTRMPGALQVLKDGPFKTMQDFVNYAKANPGKATVGVSSDGWLLHVLEIEQAFGIKLNPITVKSGGEGTNALLGKHIMAHMGGAAFAITGADKGIAAILVCGSKRLEKLPDVPTFIDLGHNISYEMVKILVVPKGTPQPVVEKLRSVFKEMSKDSEFAKKVDGSGEIYSYMDKPELEKAYKEICDNISTKVKKYQAVFENK